MCIGQSGDDPLNKATPSSRTPPSAGAAQSQSTSQSTFAAFRAHYPWMSNQTTVKAHPDGCWVKFMKIQDHQEVEEPKVKLIRGDTGTLPNITSDSIRRMRILWRIKGCKMPGPGGGASALLCFALS